MFDTGNHFRFWFSLGSVVVSNLLVIPVALMAGVGIVELIWFYWCESLILGGFQAFRILVVEYTSITYLKQSNRYEKRLEEMRNNNPETLQEFLQREDEMPMALVFLVPYVLIHAGFAGAILLTITNFNYTHALLVIGGIIFA